MQIVGYDINQDGIFTSEGEHCHDTNYLKFLVRPKPDTIKVFSNLDACVANLVSLINLSRKEASYLLTSKSKMVHLFRDGISLQYYPGKHFLAGIGWYPKFEAFSQFSDMSQHCPELKRFNNGLTGFNRAKLAQEIGEEVYAIYTKLGYEPKSLVSPVSMFRNQTYRYLDLPTIIDTPMEAGWLAYQCCPGGWIEAYKLGHFDKVYDFDLTAAYASVTAELLDLRYGKWIQSNQYQEQATYGYCQCIAKVTNDFSPILWQAERGYGEKNYTPKGTVPTFVNKRVIDFMQTRGIDYKILDGWWWTCDKEVYPLRETVHHFFEQREKNNGLTKDIVKTILVGGLYGLFLQANNDTPTESFIPPYASEIQNNTRIKVAETCLDSGIMPLAIQVDGFVSTEPIPTPKEDELGEWHLNTVGKALIASAGVVAIEGKVNKGEFSLDYNWLMRQIKDNPDASSYPMEKQAVMSLPLAYQRNRLADVGKVETERRSTHIGESKRDFAIQPKTGGELLSRVYDSKPYNAELLIKVRKMFQGEKVREIMKEEILKKPI